MYASYLCVVQHVTYRQQVTNDILRCSQVELGPSGSSGDVGNKGKGDMKGDVTEMADVLMATSTKTPGPRVVPPLFPAPIPPKPKPVVTPVDSAVNLGVPEPPPPPTRPKKSKQPGAPPPEHLLKKARTE